MKLNTLSLINGIVLILMGLWSHIYPETPSPTALIPVVLGAAILVLNKGVRRKDIGVSNAVMIITFLVLAGLVFPLSSAISRSDIPAVLRVSVMMLSSLIPLIFFIKRFAKYRLKK